MFDARKGETITGLRCTAAKKLASSFLQTLAQPLRKKELPRLNLLRSNFFWLRAHQPFFRDEHGDRPTSDKDPKKYRKRNGERQGRQARKQVIDLNAEFDPEKSEHKNNYQVGC